MKYENKNGDVDDFSHLLIFFVISFLYIYVCLVCMHPFSVLIKFKFFKYIHKCLYHSELVSLLFFLPQRAQNKRDGDKVIVVNMICFYTAEKDATRSPCGLFKSVNTHCLSQFNRYNFSFYFHKNLFPLKNDILLVKVMQMTRIDVLYILDRCGDIHMPSQFQRKIKTAIFNKKNPTEFESTICLYQHLIDSMQCQNDQLSNCLISALLLLFITNIKIDFTF